MKIYANRQKDIDLDNFVGKDIWILMRTAFGALVYVKLLHKCANDYFQLCSIPEDYMLERDHLKGRWNINHMVMEKVGAHADPDKDYWYTVVYPLDFITTPEIVETLDPSGSKNEDI